MSDAKNLKRYFIGWQCRLRQLAVRKDDGRPSAGMQATLALNSTDPNLGPVNTGLVKSGAVEITDEFRHIVRKTHDPNLRHQAAIKLLSSAYYQHPKEFDDKLTATFALRSELADQLLEAEECEMYFQQYQQQFKLCCSVTSLDENDAAYQATYWHNRMFNPVMPAAIQVLQFKPAWKSCTASPPVK